MITTYAIGAAAGTLAELVEAQRLLRGRGVRVPANVARCIERAIEQQERLVARLREHVEAQADAAVLLRDGLR